MNKTLLFTCFFLLLHYTFAQEKTYARQIVDTLASPALKGRGYVDKGDRLAAEYIRAEFRKLGLKGFTDDYFQKFTMPVNTFPGHLKLSINGQTLTPGVDYLLEAGAPPVKGAFDAVALSVTDLLNHQVLNNKLNNTGKQFLVLPAYNPANFSADQQQQIQEVINWLKYHPQSPCSGTIQITESKLTWAPSPVRQPKPHIMLKADSHTAIDDVHLHLESEWIEEYPSQNVIGYLQGSDSDSLLVLTAHYDHLGMMGSETFFPGANDNASGIAMLLSLAKHFAQNQPQYTIVFIAFGGEEIGLVGSTYFVEHPFVDLQKVRFLINFDLAGTGDDGIQVVNGSVHRQEFDRLVKINEERNLLKQVKIRGEACNSDHCMFHRKGVPAFFIYTLGGIQAYHDVDDRPETLPLTAFENYFKLMVQFIDEL